MIDSIAVIRQRAICPSASDSVYESDAAHLKRVAGAGGSVILSPNIARAGIARQVNCQPLIHEHLRADRKWPGLDPTKCLNKSVRSRLDIDVSVFVVQQNQGGTESGAGEHWDRNPFERGRSRGRRRG